MMDVMLTMEQVDDPPPECPRCHHQPPMRQEFKPVALVGSHNARAHDIMEQVASEDYHVSDMTLGRKEGDTTKVNYKDQTKGTAPSTWGVTQEALQGAIISGRQVRQQYGSGLDVLQSNLKNGTEPDLIENSKKRMIKLW
jgi:hypothetical protein